jgi:hypothetical protein
VGVERWGLILLVFVTKGKAWDAQELPIIVAKEEGLSVFTILEFLQKGHVGAVACE